MGKKHPHVSDESFSDYVRERDLREPGFKDRLDTMADQRAIARRVRELRVERNLSQAELAERAGTGQAAIARIETGRSIPKLDLLGRIAEALGVRLTVQLG